MTQLNFDDLNDAEMTVRALARDDFDDYVDRLDFSSAVERRGLNAELRRAVEELGEDEAAEIYDETFNDMEEDPCSNF